MGRTLKANWLQWAFLLALIVIVAPRFHATAAAADGLRLVVDGQLITSDPPPVLLQGRTLVPEIGRAHV